MSDPYGLSRSAAPLACALSLLAGLPLPQAWQVLRTQQESRHEAQQDHSSVPTTIDALEAGKALPACGHGGTISLAPGRD